MESPGEYLKRERELRKASLASIYEGTRVPLKYLEAIEADDYDALPHPTFVKGFIKSYCKHLGLDETDAVLRYEMYMKERSDKAEPARPSHAMNRKEPWDFSKEGRVLNNSWGIAALAGIILIIVFSYTMYGRHKAKMALLKEAATQATPAAPAPAPSPADAAQAPDKAAQAAQAPQEAPQQAPGKENNAVTAAAPATVEAAVEKKHTLVITATEVVWIKVKIDGGEPFDVVLKQGEHVVWKAADSFSLVVGNAGGVTMVYDGQELSSLGKSGEVVTLKLPRA